MFRTAVLRAARLPRVAGVSSSSIVAGLCNVALPTTSLSQTAALQGRAMPALSQAARFARFYSDNATATATATAEPQSQTESKTEPETEPESPGLITRFADLSKLNVHGAIINSLTQRMRYENMTQVQSMTIAPALEGKDIVAQAKTGTGKTLAFLIPVIQRIIDNEPSLARRSNLNRASASDIRAIIMSPTRELAEQIGEEARKVVRGTGIVVQTAVGGTHKASMLRRTKMEGCHILVATPGRLNDILSSDEDIAAPNLSALVLDEADRMLDVGFDRELREILRYLPSRAQVPRQTMLFSATVPKNVVQLARTYVDAKNFEFVQTINPEDTLTHEKVPQHIVAVDSHANLHPTLLELIQREVETAPADQPFKAVVFLSTTNFVQLTQMVFYNLHRDGHQLPRMYHIHSKLTQNQRTTAADSFRKASSAILFSSDVTARGMDFPNVTHVIQIGVPPDREQYIHRIGRTGRADKSGQGWLLVAENELNHARSLLTDLPIKRVDGFASAEHDMTVKGSEGQPKTIGAVLAAVQRVPRGLLDDTYLSFFGGATPGRNVHVTCENANAIAVHGWGLDEPPIIAESIARKRGLLKIRGMNIRRSHVSRNEWVNEEEYGDEFESKFSHSSFAGNSRRRDDRSGGGGGGGGYGYGRGSRNDRNDRNGGSNRHGGGGGFRRQERDYSDNRISNNRGGRSDRNDRGSWSSRSNSTF
ncbi:hypothetical protein SCUCBS95973_006786 [Sporothrix curviconia]|uniref:ATP-dependent RNA helicase n=1 Tax=Sporothrix curviconia TaxID=1260050 RepID=A0ABP0C813_9PEZI